MDEWEAIFDEQSGSTYYHNKASGETTWSKPEELEGITYARLLHNDDY